MSIDNDDILGGSTPKKGTNWSTVKIPNKNARQSVDSYDDNDEVEEDVNAGLFDDELPDIPQKKVKTKKQPTLEESVEDFLEDDSEDTEDEEPEQQYLQEEDTDEGEEEQEETPAPKQQQQVKKAPIPKRIEKLMSKLEAKELHIAQMEEAAARREAELINALLETQRTNANNATVAADAALKEAETAEKAAKRKWANARSLGDEESELEAFDELADAKARVLEAKRLKSTAPKAPEATQVAKEQIIGQYKSRRWLEQHANFLKNPTVVSVVKNIDAQILNEGYTIDNDDYYIEMNKRVNTVLKSRGLTSVKFGAQNDDEYEDEVVEETPNKKEVKKKPNPMGGSAAPAKRAKSQLRLDDTDKAYQRKFGVDSDTMLRQKALSKRPASQGYTPVFVPTKKKK